MHMFENSKMLFIFCRSKVGSALSPMDEECIYPSNRCLACPFGSAAEQVRGSRGSQGDMWGANSYEDAKLSRQNIDTTYSDFKGAFGDMDHRILFHLMEGYGFQDSYIATRR